VNRPVYIHSQYCVDSTERFMWNDLDGEAQFDLWTLERVLQERHSENCVSFDRVIRELKLGYGFKAWKRPRSLTGRPRRTSGETVLIWNRSGNFELDSYQYSVLIWNRSGNFELGFNQYRKDTARVNFSWESISRGNLWKSDFFCSCNQSLRETQRTLKHVDRSTRVKS
jgi:hypothetical protein